jgi:hypothetical protein
MADNLTQWSHTSGEAEELNVRIYQGNEAASEAQSSDRFPEYDY